MYRIKGPILDRSFMLWHNKDLGYIFSAHPY